VQAAAGLARVEGGAAPVFPTGAAGEGADGGDLEGAEVVSAGIVAAGGAGGSEVGCARTDEAVGRAELRDAGDVGAEQLVAEEGAAGIAEGERWGGHRVRSYFFLRGRFWAAHKNRFNVGANKQHANRTKKK
jgi:hypothetical protein